ncbi:aldolase catalytic domain-containing protein [Vibrio fluvialis]|uniref:aldolase catalytic domain-containing protein n=1 Tax=Vibrio fluvialis TaxID=676 RepID=UPI001C9CCB31|nr:aldolase catalytic domain-containing protein [Vibrio fluvialis]EKO3492069.1 aldolase catalytic domain-containing protein [Vibrio fluvialis]ELD1800041.1 aldolase catalytic domain-containing protein [Vibrio fluvialis]MBY7937210.1 aldolase catalytic domain-containing protein [Vibrio fluvialis]MCE7583154.1 aldolase catalytic domain-containing protein [Vibrio fluvialis]UPO64971.1 pyruvate carboxyltransferase [Vibrio fluvialis]
MNFSILDCTLRDGGYYNNWDFKPEVVEQYLASVAKAKIEYIELGLRNFTQKTFLGAFAYTTEEFINSLTLPDGPIYGVMVDAKTILESGMQIDDAINSLFVHSSESKIGLVRVAAHFNEVEFSASIVACLKKLGYMVGFNLMQAGGKADEVIADKARHIATWEGLDVLYFADSLGNMDGKEVERVIKALRLHWNGPMGIHTHNNMGKGLENTLTAMKGSVSWLDVTVTGMGRGAGNTQTENLLAHLDKCGVSKYQAKPIYELVIRHFEKMQREYGWGSNLLYFLGAQNDIHPTYIQNLLSSTHYGTDEIIGAIDYLSKLEGTTSYNGSVLDTALSFSNNNSKVTGSIDVQGLFDDKDILIVANSPSTEKYASAIEMYIKSARPVVISINTVGYISSELVDYYVISHNSKFLSESKRYKELDKPIILPKCRFTDEELSDIESEGTRLIDYGIDVIKNNFSTQGTYVITPYDVTTAYILGVLLESNISSISVVGFDGYEKDDVRQQEMINILNLYNAHEKSLEIRALTPTSYPVVKGSVYAPINK